VYDTGVKDGKQSSGISNNLLAILKSKVDLEVVILFWRLGHFR